MRRPTADSRKMKYLKAALAALALRRALQLPSCVADQLASDLINLNRIQAVPNISSPQARSAVTPGGLDPGADGAAARTATTPSSDSQRQISAHIFGDSAKISTARDPAFSGKENDEARNIERASLPAKPSNAEDDALVASIEAAVAESHVAALQDPALHCSSPEKEYTHFCRTLREFAAAALVSQELEDVECIFGTLKERKRARKEMDRARTVAAKQGMEQKLSTGAKKEKKRDSFSVGFGKSKKSAKQTQPTTLPSMVQLPPVDTQAYRNEVHAREYSANVAAARKKARGSAGGSVMRILDGALHMQSGVMLLAGMAKQLLHELLQIASLAPEGASISLDIGEVEGVLRSILVQGTSYAQPLAPYCAFIIQKALSDISTKALTPEDARAAALVALTSFDNLACDAAKQKAAATAEHLGARSREINERVRALAKRHEYAGLPSGIGMQIVDIVLSVLENPNGVTVVRYTKSSPSASQTQGPTVTMTVETKQPGIEQMTPVSLQPSPAEGALGFQGTSAPTAPISMPTGGRPVDITYVAVPGLTGSAVGLTSLQFFQDVGEEPKYRARFHDVLTDYTLRNVGTPQNVCITDTMVFPTGGLSFREGAGPTQSLGALATSAVERWALRRAHEAVQPAVTLFRDDETIKEYAAQLLKRHISSLKEATSPAPSFNGLTSSGCTSYSDDARRLFYEHFYSNQLFSMVKQNVKTNSKLQLRAQLLQTQGIIPAMPMNVDLTVSQAMGTIQKTLHEERGKRRKASKYGFLDVCDTKCYTREKSRRSDVLASAIYTLDHTLAKLNSMAYRALTISGSFFGDLNLNPQNSEASKHVKARTALSTMLSLWTAKQQKGEKKGRLPEGIATAMEDYSIALECYANMMSQSPETRNVYNLAAHTWVQLRGIHNAAEGFIPGKGSKISERNKQVAAVFSKLWFEADPAFVQTPGSLLKPFPGLMASVALQVAFFLHSVVGEYNAGLWKQMGVAVKSFFVGLFRRNKRMKVPNSWKQVEARAYPGPRTDVKGFQGALHTISQLAKTFHERFLEQAMAVHDSSTLLPPYIAFIHGLVAQWMNPYGGKFSINDPHISKAKKLFYYSVFIHPKGLTYVASELIRAGCKGLGKIDVGEVRATVEHSGKRQAVGATILRQKPVSIKGSALEYHLNMLLATYEDPFDLIRVAQDLATRCQAGAGLAGSTSFLEQDAGAEGSEKKKRFGFPSVGIPNLSEKKGKEWPKLISLLSVGLGNEPLFGSRELHIVKNSRKLLIQLSKSSEKGETQKSGFFKWPSFGFPMPKKKAEEPKVESYELSRDDSGEDAKEKRAFEIPSVGVGVALILQPPLCVQLYESREVEFPKPTTAEEKTEPRPDVTGLDSFQAQPSLYKEGKKTSKFPNVRCKKQKIHDPNQERLVQIMSSKFVLDTWCLKYKDFVAKTLTEVPKTTNTQELSLLLEEALDKITEVVLTSATCDTFWVLNLKCPFMRDFIDAEMRLKTRRAMLHYAISRRGIGKRLRRKLRAIKNWFTKKFTWKRRRKPGLRADNEWAVIHAGTSTWDPQKKRFEHTLTFRPESMACSSQQEPTKLIDFQDGKFAIGNLGADTINDAVLCVKDDVYCWATRRALMFKGSTEAPIAHTEQPAGLWYSRLSGVSGPSTKGSRS